MNKKITMFALISSAAFVSLPSIADEYLFSSEDSSDFSALSQGSKEFGIQGDLNLDYADSYLLNLSSSYGYFIVDNFQLGTDFSLSVSDNVQSYRAGVFGEYNFDLGSKFVPYVGTGAQFMYSEFFGESESTLNLRAALGVKYFVASNVAISTEVNYNIANNDAYIDENGFAKNDNTTFMIGTRYYF